MNLFYYNIFRFQCFTQYLMAYPYYSLIRITGLGRVMAKRMEKENWDEYLISVLNDPKGGISRYIAGINVGIFVFLLVLTLLNIFCGLIQADFHKLWLYGMIAGGILALIISNYAAPTDPKKYLKDFKRFRLMSKAEKRQSALLTFLIVIGICSVFVGSFIFYLRSSVH